MKQIVTKPTELDLRSTIGSVIFELDHLLKISIKDDNDRIVLKGMLRELKMGLEDKVIMVKDV